LPSHGRHSRPFLTFRQTDPLPTARVNAGKRIEGGIVPVAFPRPQPKANLIERVELISRYRNRVTLTERDGIDLITDMLSDGSVTFFYVDPPYIDKGEDLYLNDLHWEDHVRLATVLTNSGGCWMATYNCDERIPGELYPSNRCIQFDIKHTAQRQQIGAEYAIFSASLSVESLEGLSIGDVHVLR
jgi:site-specific DNA-adenine methylase